MECNREWARVCLTRWSVSVVCGSLYSICQSSLAVCPYAVQKGVVAIHAHRRRPECPCSGGEETALDGWSRVAYVQNVCSSWAYMVVSWGCVYCRRRVSRVGVWSYRGVVPWAYGRRRGCTVGELVDAERAPSVCLADLRAAAVKSWPSCTTFRQTDAFSYSLPFFVPSQSAFLSAVGSPSILDVSRLVGCSYRELRKGPVQSSPLFVVHNRVCVRHSYDDNGTSRVRPWHSMWR